MRSFPNYGTLVPYLPVLTVKVCDTNNHARNKCIFLPVRCGAEAGRSAMRTGSRNKVQGDVTDDGINE